MSGRAAADSAGRLAVEAAPPGPGRGAGRPYAALLVARLGRRLEDTPRYTPLPARRHLARGSQVPADSVAAAGPGVAWALGPAGPGAGHGHGGLA